MWNWKWGLFFLLLNAHKDVQRLNVDLYRNVSSSLWSVETVLLSTSYMNSGLPLRPWVHLWLFVRKALGAKLQFQNSSFHLSHCVIYDTICSDWLMETWNYTDPGKTAFSVNWRICNCKLKLGQLSVTSFLWLLPLSVYLVVFCVFYWLALLKLFGFCYCTKL